VTVEIDGEATYDETDGDDHDDETDGDDHDGDETVDGTADEVNDEAEIDETVYPDSVMTGVDHDGAGV